MISNNKLTILPRTNLITLYKKKKHINSWFWRIPHVLLKGFHLEVKIFVGYENMKQISIFIVMTLINSGEIFITGLRSCSGQRECILKTKLFKYDFRIYDEKIFENFMKEKDLGSKRVHFLLSAIVHCAWL